MLCVVVISVRDADMRTIGSRRAHELFAGDAGEDESSSRERDCERVETGGIREGYHEHIVRNEAVTRAGK